MEEDTMSQRWLFDDEDDEFEDEDDDQEGAKKSSEDPRMMERFLRSRTILVSEPISSTLARSVYQQLIMLERDDAKKPITVIVNSPGGEADAGFGMYDMIRFVSCPVRTLVAGLCASAGVMVFLAGDRGQRFSLPNSRFLLHQPSSQSWGQASDLEIAAREILRLRDQYNRIVAEETGRTVEKVTEDADRDFWMSAKEAAEYGLVTRVVNSRAELD